MLVLFAIGLIALLTSATALAAQTFNGYEYYFTSTDAKFAGSASGALPGSWNADVRHTALCLSCTPTATITGGSFSLAITLEGSSALVTGAFTAGTIQVTNVGSNCSNRTFDIEGMLGHVGPWYSDAGSGSLSATLTHHRHWVFGTCVTYAASVTGTIALTF